MTMMKRIASGALCCLLLCLSFAGCSKKALGDSPVPLETVTQNDQGNRVTFEFGLPSGWVSGSPYDYAIEAVNIKKYAGEEEPALRLGISNYRRVGWSFSEEDEKRMDDLFQGKTEAYEQHINKLMEKTNTKVDHFQFQYYKGTYGTIVEVQYTYTYQGEPFHEIRCYRQDIPYMVTGAFKDSNELSSGDIVPWIADSLKVTEHFQTQSDTSQEQ